MKATCKIREQGEKAVTMSLEDERRNQTCCEPLTVFAGVKTPDEASRNPDQAKGVETEF